MSAALLLVGYVVAVPPLFRLRAILRRRQVRWFAAEELGTAAIVAGWALRGRWPAVAVNAAWGVGLAAWWFLRRDR